MSQKKYHFNRNKKKIYKKKFHLISIFYNNNKIQMKTKSRLLKAKLFLKIN
jgi:hypothetical protein